MKRLLLTIPTLLGTEQIVANEVRHLGYDTKEVKDGSVTFEGDAQAICLGNICLRSAERIMIKLAEFKATSFDELFEKVKKINWESIIEKDAAFPVKGHCLKSTLHSVPDCQAIIKKSIVSRLSNHYGIQHFEETGPLYPVQFSIMKDVATIYIDTSGENLYKRGYREKSVLAPMRETLAYSMIDLTFWRGDRMFIDPFCGSGTLPIEAAMYAANIAPGLKRRFVAESWRNHIPKNVWNDARDEAKENIRKNIKTEIFASDIDPEAIEIAKKNAQNAGVLDMIHFSVCDVAKLTPSKEKGVIVCNPPYGERLLDKKQCDRLYRTMGRKFAEFPLMKKFILTSYEDFEQSYGSFADKRRKVYNGMLKCYIYQYFK